MAAQLLLYCPYFCVNVTRVQAGTLQAEVQCRQLGVSVSEESTVDLGEEPRLQQEMLKYVMRSVDTTPRHAAAHRYCRRQQDTHVQSGNGYATFDNLTGENLAVPVPEKVLPVRIGS